MKHFHLKYFLYLCLAVNFIVSNSSETFLKPEAHESSLHDKVISREPRAFIFKDMGHKRICVEIDGVFYDSCRYAGRIIGCSPVTIKNRYLSDNFPNYQIVPFRVTYTEKQCTKCGRVKLLEEFSKESTCKDGFRCKCKECKAKYDKKWRKNNTDYIIEYRNRPEVKTKKSRKAKEREKTDIAFRVNRTMSVSVNQSLKGGKNGAHWEDLVDWTIEELIIHLESLFTEGMSWDNYGRGKYQWNIDHVIAKCKFNITSNTCQEFRDCWTLSNLQPLWAIRNFEKGTKPMEPKYLIKPF